LDRVCEEKDNKIRELKILLHEKQLEIDHQMSSFKRQKDEFSEEINKLRIEIKDMNEMFEIKLTKLTEINESLGSYVFIGLRNVSNEKLSFQRKNFLI
jgi:uncharacterized coiled-coil DUF342 family protein